MKLFLVFKVVNRSTSQYYDDGGQWDIDVELITEDETLAYKTAHLKHLKVKELTLD